LRPTQEDRFVLVPRFFSEEALFCGVFDGTVGHDASEYIMQNICRILCDTNEIAEIIRLFEVNSQGQEVSNESIAGFIRAALRNTFLNSDRALINMCAEKQLHYASSTGVSIFLWRNLLTVAHIGDSKACIAKVINGSLHVEWLTVDHKPNMPNELQRIEASGGSLAWLHGNKPYIRGGDFFRRQANGEHPKQLNYSRAFGGKDLKMFGLSAEPDINHFEISKEDKLVLLASDGLWDVLNPQQACEIALTARREGRLGSKDIVQRAIQEMPVCGVRDNITVIAIFLNE
jgi:serine/threonine protein phosphatase PrpC